MPRSAFISALLLACSLHSLSALAQGAYEGDAALGAALDPIVDAEAFSDAFWGIHVVDLETGRTLYSRNAARNFVPASNMKLYTTAAALDLLGPFYRFETSLYIDGAVRDGVLHGNLIVRGGADPTIGGHYRTSGEWDAELDDLQLFRDWADSLAAAGIRRIDGDIIGDDDIIDDVPLGASWAWDDETYYYSAQMSGLTFHDNVVHLRVTAQARNAPALVDWEPIRTDYIEVVNRTRTVGPQHELDEGYHRLRGTNVIEVTTEVPERADDLEEITVENPTLYFVHVFRESLLASGVAVSGRPVDVDMAPIKPAYDESGLRRIAVHQSAPLADVAALINKPSQNLYADLLLKKLGTELPADRGELEPGSAAMGVEAAKITFARAGIDTSRIRMADGSGLSRLNLVSPRMTTSLLAYMWMHDDTAVRAAFYDSLPVAGEQGTLRYRLTSGPARGVVRGKTGTLSAASSLSGYARTESGRMLAFSIMSNHYTSRSGPVRAAQDAVVNRIVRYAP